MPNAKSSKETVHLLHSCTCEELKKQIDTVQEYDENTKLNHYFCAEVKFGTDPDWSFRSGTSAMANVRIRYATKLSSELSGVRRT